MKLLIDSHPFELAPTGTSFTEYCKALMSHLLQQEKSISSIKIDGVTLHSLEEATEQFNQAELIEVQTLPLIDAMQSAMSLHCSILDKLEKDCENLITDSLLAEPPVIASQWSNLCQGIKERITFLPHLAHFLSVEEISQLTERHCEPLQEIMQQMGDLFNKADVVSFSDLLELKLLPWLKAFRATSQDIAKHIESVTR